MNTDVQRHNLGRRGVLSELNGIMATEVFKELSEGVGVVTPEKVDVTDKPQPEAGITG